MSDPGRCKADIRDKCEAWISRVHLLRDIDIYYWDTVAASGGIGARSNPGMGRPVQPPLTACAAR